MEKLHLEMLDDSRKALFPKLSAFQKTGYLAGGTALALQIGHRLSYDFDIFCPKEISLTFAAKAKKIFSIEQTLVNSSDEATFIVAGDVKISFIFYPFSLEKFILKKETCPLKILSPLGVIVTKAYAMSRRGAWRDYLDLYVALEKKITSVDEIIREAENVYGELFNQKMFLSQLVYIGDVSKKEVEETRLFGGKVSAGRVKKYFQGEVAAYFNKLKKG
ncbi:MAG TPA: nucleotidyl transferase AbiEii/AbiGii toxin family protein [Patescibacteria group bacterium]